MHWGRILLTVLSGVILSGAPFHQGIASGPAVAKEARDGEMKIDCITPDGRLVSLPGAIEKESGMPVLNNKEDTLRCPLQEGETTFIISFPKTSLVDRFTFANENASVRGDMRIAVSNTKLPANSPDWAEVSGKTEFISKQLFNLSLVGVDARYVKLSFHVEKGHPIASIE